jgi:hypothetical protein
MFYVVIVMGMTPVPRQDTRGVQVKPGLLTLQVQKGMLAWRYYTQ